MARRSLRMRIDDEGQLEIVDPGHDSLALLEMIKPDFVVRSSVDLGLSRPRLLMIRDSGCGLRADSLESEPYDTLWNNHSSLMNQVRQGVHVRHAGQGEASVLGLKIELARRALERCGLCGHQCGVDRTQKQFGRCHLGSEALLVEYFVHIAEESVINPSLLMSFSGCGLRCGYCQQWQIIEPSAVRAQPLTPELWSRLDARGAKTLSFAGGNPDESLYGILRFLEAMPIDWTLPIVWNCHGYSAAKTIDLLECVVDCYLPDFKYGNADCGKRLSGCENYPEVAETCLAAMLAQDVPVIVRLLILPGHVECCHIPTLQTLAKLNADNLFLSVRDQYCPDWKISAMDGELARRVSPSEIHLIRNRAEQLELRVVE